MSENKSMFIFIGALALLLAGLAVYNFMGKSPVAPTPTPISFSATPVPTVSPTPSSANLQVVAIRALSTGTYDKPEVAVKAGIPVRLDFSADSGAGCGRQFILDGFNVQLTSNSGETTSATFTPTSVGDYAYHCGMNMWRGTLHVV